MRAQRELTDQERRLVKLVGEYEKAISDRALSFVIIVGESGMAAMIRGENMGYFAFLKYVESKTKEGQNVYKVRFAIHEFEKYLHFILQQSNMAYLMNYNLILQDGYGVEITT